LIWLVVLVLLVSIASVWSSCNSVDYNYNGMPCMYVGYVLNSNGLFLNSSNGLYSLIYQADGNLVGYNRSNNVAFWDSETSNPALNCPFTIELQSDGNLVLYGYSSGGVKTAYWNTGTQGNSVSKFCMQDDRNIVLYDTSGGAIWQSATPLCSPGSYGPDGYHCQLCAAGTYSSAAGSTSCLTCPIGNTSLIGSTSCPLKESFGCVNTTSGVFVFNQGESLASLNGNYKLVVQTDGNLVLYNTSRNEYWWSSGTQNQGSNGPITLELNTNGNLTLFSHPSGVKTAYWTAAAAPISAYYSLCMQNDRNVVLFNATGQYYWATWTEMWLHSFKIPFTISCIDLTNLFV